MPDPLYKTPRQPIDWRRALIQLLVGLILGAGATCGAVFGLGSGDGHDPAYEQDVGFLLGDDLLEALDAGRSDGGEQ